MAFSLSSCRSLFRRFSWSVVLRLFLSKEPTFVDSAALRLLLREHIEGIKAEAAQPKSRGGRSGSLDHGPCLTRPQLDPSSRLAIGSHNPGTISKCKPRQRHRHPHWRMASHEQARGSCPGSSGHYSEPAPASSEGGQNLLTTMVGRYLPNPDCPRPWSRLRPASCRFPQKPKAQSMSLAKAMLRLANKLQTGVATIDVAAYRTTLKRY